jgi:hypothetical protein
MMWIPLTLLAWVFEAIDLNSSLFLKFIVRLPHHELRSSPGGLSHEIMFRLEIKPEI